ncbi:MAG: Laccase domain protein YfiH [Chlamydiae bacterium]|nr:Laccase domain protein YfiH [Chlamydiota bacterium]
MRIRKNHIEDVELIEYPIFDEFSDIKAFTTLRKGGFSKAPFSSLNVSFDVEDDPKAVQKNREKILQIGELKTLQFARQVHGTDIEYVSEVKTRVCDGLITQEKDLALGIMHADCQAVFFYDPITHTTAIVHAGWRGSVQNIFLHMIQKLKKIYVKPENLFVAISPSLGPEWAEFRNYKKELPQSFLDFQVKPLYFDFWEITKWQLKKLGVLDHHIQCAHLCTYDNQDMFSFRRDKTTGRLASVLVVT